jgi:putative membrane-bound dehydrogenase-like protein
MRNLSMTNRYNAFGLAMRAALGGIGALVCLALALNCSSGRAESPPLTRPAPTLTTDIKDSEALVGVAVVDATPDYRVRLSGFGGRRDESDGVTHKIWVKALAIGDDAKSAAVLITVDNLGIPDWMSQQVAKRLKTKLGLDPERLTITYTHTHTAPMLRGAASTIFGVPIPPEHQANIDKYTDEMVGKLEEAATKAIESRVRSRLSWSVGRATFAHNRRGGGQFDHDLPVLFVHDLDGKPRAIYTSYACHCVTFGHNKISGDWAGYAAEAIEKLFPGATGMVSIGCAADQNPSAGVTNGDVEKAMAQGREIGEEIKRLEQLPRRSIKGRVDVGYQRIELPLAALPKREDWEQRAKDANGWVAHHAKTQLAKLDRGEKLKTSVDYPVQTWMFGDDLAMVFLAGEVVVDYSLRLKRELDAERVWIHGYANEYPCYIPSERILREGGYEGGDSAIYFDMPGRFAPGLEAKIIDAVHKITPDAYNAAHDAAKTGGTSPLSPERSLAAMRTRPDMTVELVAAEPLVVDPVAIDFGADGRLWVAEMRDYPAGIDGKYGPGGRVKHLTDVNGDGRYDEATTFLDGIPFPTGVTVWNKGVLVCTAPDILYAEDTDNDGKADVIKKLFTGFATHNFQARVNSLQYGLDNWVYASTGLFGGKISSFRGNEIDLTSRDFRMMPDTGEIEPVTGQTQQSRVRDDWGNWFGCDSGTLIRHYPVVDHYVRRNPQYAPPATAINVADYPNSNRLFPISPVVTFKLSGPPGLVTAACGLGIYRDELLGKEFAGNAFTCEPVCQVVHRLVLSPHDASFSGRRAKDEQQSEFLASSDNWFRPVQARTGPDGALYVVDMYRYVIEHPIWIPPEVVATLDVRAGDTRGRIYRVFPKNHPPRPIVRLNKSDTAGLVAALDSPNGPQRDLSQRMLVDRGDRSAVTLLERLARESNRPQTRLQALCALDGLHALAAGSVEHALGDEHPGVRRHAIRLAERFAGKSDRILAMLGKLVDDKDAQVRIQLAYTMGEFRGDEAATALATLASTYSDDPYLVAAAMSSLRAENARPFTRQVLSLAASQKRESPERVLSALLAMDFAANDPQLWSDVLQSAAANASEPPRAWKFTLLARLLAARDRSGDSQARPLSADDERRIETLLTLAREKIRDEKSDLAMRIAALGVLGIGNAPAADADRALLANLLSPRQSVEIQLAAVNQLATVAGDAAPSLLLNRWSVCSPAVRAGILDALLNRPTGQTALLDMLERGTITIADLDATRRQRLLEGADEKTRTRAAKLVTTTSNADRHQLIEQYNSAATKGDAKKGQAVFAKACAACHKLGNVGVLVGPDLAPLASKPRQTLLAAILDPNQAVDPRYISYQALTDAGESISGLLSTETATSIVLTSQDGKQHTLLRSEIDEFKSTGKSLMPEGLEKDVSPAQMADLLAFLATTATPPKSFAGNVPTVVGSNDDGVVLLSAENCEIRGPSVVFEDQFQNLGMWHSAEDSATWTIDANAAGKYRVFLEFACDDSAAGNTLIVESEGEPIKSRIPATGAWSRYQLVEIGELSLRAGVSSLVVRSDGAIRGALVDLRTLQLVPPTGKPQPTLAQTAKEMPVSEAAALILSDKTAAGDGERLVSDNLSRAAELVAALAAGLPDDAKDNTEEYRRIPWIWRVSIAAGRHNDRAQLKALLNASLPSESEPLRDWQAVVIGGGIINGITQAGVWPRKRIEELFAEDAALAARWRRAIELSVAMTHDEKVPAGTRYDALRMLGVDTWEKRGAEIVKYLGPKVNAELQMGAVSALGDMDEPPAAAALVASLADLAPGNRNLALDALLRNPARAQLLLDEIAKGRHSADMLGGERIKRLKNYNDDAVRRLAAKVLP